MGWLDDELDDEVASAHEGWAAQRVDDGRLAASSDNAGVYVAGAAGAMGASAGTREHVPYDRVVGWTVACVCGWTGATWLYTAVVLSCPPAAGPDPTDALLPDGRTVEDVARSQWRTHVAPLGAAGRIRAAAAAVTDAVQALDEAVRIARVQTPPLSWDQIGRAAGITRQSAHERWGTRGASR